MLLLILGCGLLHACAMRPHVSVLSDDGTWQAVASSGGTTLTIRKFDGTSERTIAIASPDGARRGRVAMIVFAHDRRSFLVTFDALAELWELSVDPNAAPIFDGLVHDYRMGEAIARNGFLHPRRTPLAQTIVAIAPAVREGYAVAHVAHANPHCARVQLLHLDARRVIAQFDIVGAPLVAAAALSSDRSSGPIFTIPQTNAATLRLDARMRSLANAKACPAQSN